MGGLNVDFEREISDGHELQRLPRIHADERGSKNCRRYSVLSPDSVYQPAEKFRRSGFLDLPITCDHQKLSCSAPALLLRSSRKWAAWRCRAFRDKCRSGRDGESHARSWHATTST